MDNEKYSLKLEWDEESITVEKLTDYLTSHIAEMTNIEKIARHFMVSRSYLSKKTKELTGLSVQTLHEKLKIEYVLTANEVG